MSKIRLDIVGNLTILSAIDDKHDMHDLLVLLTVILYHSMIYSTLKLALHIILSLARPHRQMICRYF
jgi:hypothetical protein